MPSEVASASLVSEIVLDVEPMPIAVIREEAVRQNIATFASYCRRHGVELAPHVKTSMSPEIFALQREAGAWGATVANAPQARSVYSWGVDRILIANEMVDRTGLRWLIDACEADDELEAYFWVDSVEAVELASSVHTQAGARRPLRVLLEFGHESGRAGCRTQTAARQVAMAVAETSGIELWGISGFEGTISKGSPESTRSAVDEFLHQMRCGYDVLASDGLIRPERPLISAGGSAYFDRVVEAFADLAEARVILRSGCYVTHDAGVYDFLSPMGGPAGALRPALEVWGSVLSVPEPALAIIGIGKRDASYDAGLPVPRLWRTDRGPVQNIPEGIKLYALNDQHAYLRDPSRRLGVGDLVGCWISHPCTTFDKWRCLHLVDERYRKVDSISTYF